MKFILFIIVIFYGSSALSQDHNIQFSSAIINNDSDSALLKKAKSLKNKDTKASIELAHEALRIAESNNNDSVSGQSHTLLGKIFQKSKDNEKSLEHFLQASLIYKKMNDQRNQILNSIHYITILLAEKKYDQVSKSIDEMFPVALEYNDTSLIALLFISKGDSYYKTKNYNEAIAQYTQVFKYLSKDDKKVQKRLAETYKKIAQAYKSLQKREQAAYFYKKSLDIYTVLNDKKSMAQILNALAETERYLGHLTVALEYSQSSLDVYKEINDPEGYNKALLGAGILYRHIGRYEKSLKHLHKAHLYYKKEKDFNNIADTSNQLGAIYTRLQQFDQARAFYQVSIDLPKKYIKQKTLASTFRQMAVIDLNSENYESALVMAQRAHRIYIENDNKLKAVISARIIASIFRAQNQDKKAISYYKESLKLATELGSDIHTAKAKIPLASILIGKDTNEAVSLLKESLALAIKVDNKVLILDAYRKLGEAEKSRNNFEQSLYYAEEEKILTNVIQNEKDEQQLVLMKANVYSHQIEIELESLKEKGRLDQLELAKKNNEIELVKQTRVITELELIKNQYANIALALLLAICILVVVLIYIRFHAAKKRNQELDDLVVRDPLTNCYNRRALFDIMKDSVDDLGALGESCIIMADIDHFKQVNDIHGHIIGDDVICGVANLLQRIISKNDILVRFGGEEFCILLNKTPQSDVMLLAEKMRSEVAISSFHDVVVTCSFGISSTTFNAKTPIELINQADAALYQSKSNGRNQVTLWDKNFSE